MNHLPKYRTPILGEEILELALEHPKDARQYLEILELHQQLQEARKTRIFTPVIFLGLLDVNPVATVVNAYRTWQFNEDVSHILLAAGQHAGAGTRHLLGAENLRQHLPDNPGLRVFSQVAADNTPEQAIWLCDKVEELGLRSIALRAPWFHIPRAYLTVVAEMRKRCIYFELLPWPLQLDPDTSYPLAGFADQGKNIELLFGEISRLCSYRGKGVADYGDAVDYLVDLQESLSRTPV